MIKQFDFSKKNWFVFFLFCFSTILNAQVVDTLKSKQVYTMLTFCNYYKTTDVSQ